ncbi:peptidylprolyl isomerase [Thermodesulfobacteriota bacterium]
MNSNKNHKEHRLGHSFVVCMSVLVFVIMSPGYMALLSPYPFNQGLAFAETREKPADINDIAAEVNGNKVTVQEVLKRYNLYSLISRYSEDKKENLKIDSYVDIYIIELLLLREADEMKIKVDRGEVEKEKEEYLARNDLTEEKLLENLKKNGLTTEDVYRYFENNLILSRFGDKKFGVTDVSDEDARKFYSNNEEYYNRPEKISVSHILVCHRDSQGCTGQLNKQEAEGLAKNIRKLVTPGNFPELAKKYSGDPTGADGGDMGELTRGSAVPAFEKAAFSLEAGEMSDVVETDFGFHIIYVKSKQKARSIKFEEVKESIKNDIKKRYITLGLFNYSRELLNGAEVKRYAVIDDKLVKEPESNTLSSSGGESTRSSDIAGKTFRLTDKNLCKNSKGQPVIMMFSTPDCPHCNWIAETFDDTVMEYAGRGLIEAHHYDVVSKDDLLTPEIETDIPERYLKIYEDSQGYVPYFSFGCIYHRVANGYEREDDLYAEEVEMRQVIDSLIK